MGISRRPGRGNCVRERHWTPGPGSAQEGHATDAQYLIDVILPLTLLYQIIRDTLRCAAFLLYRVCYWDCMDIDLSLCIRPRGHSKYLYGAELLRQFHLPRLPIRLMQTPATCGVRPRAGIEVGIGRRLDPARDAEQRAEGVERVEPSVEAERELVEVGL